MNGSLFDHYLNTPDGEHFYRVLMIQVYFAIQMFMWSRYILRMHFSSGVGVAFGFGVIIFCSWGRIVHLNHKLADPMYGF